MNENSELLNQFTDNLPLLLAAFNSSSNGIIIIDHQQENDPIIYCNPAFEQITGYDKGDVFGKNCRFLQGEERLQEGRFTIKEALANNSQCVAELRNYRKDGSEFWNEIFISPITNNEGITTHFIGVQNDISDRKLNEICMGTEMKQAEKLKQQKNDFISAASHELKTPLTSLKASLQLLEKINPDPKTTKVTALISQANRSINKVNKLIEELLISDQLVEGKLELSKSHFVLGRLISECCSNIQLEGKYDIVVNGEKNIEVYADFERLDQVVLNFVDNAVKYASDSTTISVYLSKTFNEAKVIIHDGGPGIAADKLPHLFDRFYKGEPEGEQYSGLGIGLYISAQIIKNHGGNIGVESELGKGSSFWFTLPLEQSEVA